jgi:hypothetical protein
MDSGMTLEGWLAQNEEGGWDIVSWGYEHSLPGQT